MIDKKPAVGRILVREPVLKAGCFRTGGRITRIKSSAIFMIDHPEHGEVKVNGFAAICDTEEEHDKLVLMSRRHVEEFISMTERHKEEIASVFK